MIRSIGAAVLAVGMVSGAQAGEEELYLGFSLGSLDISGKGLEGDTIFLDGDSIFAEVTAGVQITEVVSVEVSYQHFDEFDGAGGKVKGTASNLSVLAEKGIDERLGLLGRMFFQFAELKIEGPTFTGTENGSDLGFGVGITYKLGEEKNNTLRLEYRTVDPGASGDEEFISLGIIHYFD